MLVLLKQDFPFSVWMGIEVDRKEYFNSMIEVRETLTTPPPGTYF